MSGLLDAALKTVRRMSSRKKVVVTCASCGTKHGEKDPLPADMICTLCANRLQPAPPPGPRNPNHPVNPILPPQDKQKMSAFIATIPPNVRPGQQFAAFLNGEKRIFVCPPGAGPGSKVQVLVPAPASPTPVAQPVFIPSQTFQGPKPGYVFAARRAGTGYHLDNNSSSSSNNNNNNSNSNNNTNGRESRAPSSEGFILIDPPSWSCTSCTTVNNGKGLACSVCRKPKSNPMGGGSKNEEGKSGGVDHASSKQGSASQIQCEQCTYVNPAGTDKCKMCQCVLSTQTQGPSDWICASCTYNNHADQTHCSMCNTQRGSAGTLAGGGRGGGGGGSKSIESKTNGSTISPDPAVNKAYAALQQGMSDGNIRKLLKQELKLSTGKAQKALRTAKDLIKHGNSNEEGKRQPSILRQASYSMECGMCSERIQKGNSFTRGGLKVTSTDSDKYKLCTAATCLCEHYFCFECLGNYVEQKITSGEVQEDQIDCPNPNCSASMLQDPLGEFTPNYLFTQLDGKATGILGNAFPYSVACKLNQKLLNHRNRNADLFITCPNPKCEIKVYVEENVQFFRCEKQFHGCGESFCKLCKRAAHGPIKDCKQAQLSEKADADSVEMTERVLAEGGRYCPSCSELFAAEFVNPDKWPCDHITCPCGYQFCRNCGCNRQLVVDHDNSWHVPKCGLWDTYTGCVDDERKPKDWPRVWKEKDPQFNSIGASFFKHSAHRIKWTLLGRLKTKKNPTQGTFRKCQPNCGCAYGNGHSKFQLNKK